MTRRNESRAWALLKDLRRGSEEENGAVSIRTPGERYMNPG